MKSVRGGQGRGTSLPEAAAGGAACPGRGQFSLGGGSFPRCWGAVSRGGGQGCVCVCVCVPPERGGQCRSCPGC